MSGASGIMLVTSKISKTFIGTKVLSDVEFGVSSGEIHVLFGENGAGKSTLINIITGNLRPDEGGRVELDGVHIEAASPQVARNLGIAAVFQEFSLIPGLSVLDNLFLGREEKRFGFISRSRMRARAEKVVADLGFEIDLDAEVESLSRARQQMVEITKALMVEPKILILDEPTASLTDSEADRLMEMVIRLKARGVGLIYVSHRIKEIQKLADRVTVLRSGKRIGTIQRAEVTEQTLVEMMTGRRIDDLFPDIPHQPKEVRCEMEDVSTRSKSVSNVSLSVRAGEIVGIAGLVGCGKSEVGQALFGLDRVGSGKIKINGVEVQPTSPRQMMGTGVCYFPADRGKDGLALERSILENATMAALDLPRFTKGGWLHKSRERQEAQSATEQLAVKPLDLDAPVSSLSGGNRQKVMLARGLMRDFTVFVFDEPTVGIDVGAKVEVYKFMRNLVAAGAAVVVISSELPEVLALSNRVYVMSEGSIVKELIDTERTYENALHAFFGRTPSSPVRLEAAK